eukprot:1059053-Pelagomonas_calceolata.AAC.1
MSRSSAGVLWVTVASMRGIQGKPVEIVEGIPAIWKRNVRGVHECCSACTGVCPHITNDTRVGFNFIDAYRVWRAALGDLGCFKKSEMAWMSSAWWVLIHIGLR